MPDHPADTNPMDDVVEIKESLDDGKSVMWVAVVRHLMRPFLIVFFSCLYALTMVLGLFFAYYGKLDLKDVFILVSTNVSSTLGIIIGYQFGKPSTVDKNKQ